MFLPPSKRLSSQTNWQRTPIHSSKLISNDPAFFHGSEHQPWQADRGRCSIPRGLKLDGSAEHSRGTQPSRLKLPEADVHLLAVGPSSAAQSRHLPLPPSPTGRACSPQILAPRLLLPPEPTLGEKKGSQPSQNTHLLLSVQRGLHSSTVGPHMHTQGRGQPCHPVPPTQPQGDPTARSPRRHGRSRQVRAPHTAPHTVRPGPPGPVL